MQQETSSQEISCQEKGHKEKSRQVSNNRTVAKLLLVEDDDDLAELIQMHIKFQGHETVRVTRCDEAMQLYKQQSFDLIVLDRGLPDGDGLDICHQLRQENDWVPVLVLTARDSEMEKVQGLEVGVDDYIAKPFSVLEFQARVRNMLRRSHSVIHTETNTETQFGSGTSVTLNAQIKRDTRSKSDGSIKLDSGLTINSERHQVWLNNKDILLTATEFSLLQFMANRPGRVFSKEELLLHVWNTDYSGYHHTVCSTINRLRTKLAQADNSPQLIQTVWGVGYKFQPRS
ncbi:response regulator transcription factor [Vibrio sp. FNV 38]|nr:response regulator transcription factor [Vibrio sp. FNV 38]